MKKIAFFDRDDTLIKNIPYLNDPEKVEFFDDTIDTLQNLKLLGYEFIIVSNQSGIDRKLITLEQLDSVHQRLIKLLGENNINILKIYFSPYLPTSNHPTRKPNPGMILQAFKDFNIDKNKSFMVGDKVCDGQAGINAGLKSFVLNRKVEQCTQIEKLSDLLKFIKN